MFRRVSTKLTSVAVATVVVFTGLSGQLLATATTLPMVDDFETPLISGSTGSIPLGFYQATDPKSALSYERSSTLPEPVPGSATGNSALKVDATVDAWAVVVHAFSDDPATQWIPQDWSASEGMQFWFHGTGAGTTLFIDVIDNRTAGSTTDDGERFSTTFTDTTAGWRLVQLPFDAFARKDIGNGAPNDGFGLTEIHGWAFGSLATSGAKTFYVDDVSLYGVAPIRPLTVGFGTVETKVVEGQSASVPVKLSKVSDAPVTVTVKSTISTARVGLDYDAVNTTVTIPAGSTTASVSVPTRDDDSYLGDRSAVLELSGVSGAELGKPPVSRLLITDNEQFDPTLIEDFVTPPHLWTPGRKVTLKQRTIPVGDPRARPGATAPEQILAASSDAWTTEVTRTFAQEQDWSSSDALTFWYYGRNSKRPVNVTLSNPTQSATAGDPASWPLLWADEFNTADGTPPNPKFWRAELGDGTVNGIPGWGNDELQYYTAKRTNAATDGRGNLVITTRKTDAGDAPLCYYGPCTYTSARLLTQDRAEFAYGRLEARVKVPEGAGLWPAFWSLGTDIRQTPWPRAGEIDIMEHVGREPYRIFGTLHGPGYAGGQSYGDDYIFPTKVADTFHTYRVDWYKDRVVWAVDGIQYHEAIPANVAPNDWVYNHPFFLLLNVAVGGNFGGAVGAETQFPARTKIDYVRAYQADRLPSRHTVSFTDNSVGWRKVSIPLADFGANFDASQVLSLSVATKTHPDGAMLLDEFALSCGESATVTTTADSGAGSLRRAIGSVCPGGTITLDPALAGQTIALDTPLSITGPVTIDGSAAAGASISGGGDSRILEVAKGAKATVKGLTLTGGYGWELAGAVLNNGDLTLDHVTVTKNSVTTGGIDFWKGGAGIYSGEGSTLRLVDSTISDNTVTGGAGGGIYSFFGTTTTIERSTISGNTVNDVGGGLRLLGNASITNSTVSGNATTGWHGGGIFQTDGTLTLTHTTVTGNTSPGGTAAGLFVGTFGASGAKIEYAASVVAGNSGEQCFLAPFGSGPVAFTSLGGSLVGDGTCAPVAADRVVADALLGPLADNGGPTLTHLPADGSPAVDAATTSTLTVDQRGSSRPLGSAADAGAVEAR